MWRNHESWWTRAPKTKPGVWILVNTATFMQCHEELNRQGKQLETTTGTSNIIHKFFSAFLTYVQVLRPSYLQHPDDIYNQFHHHEQENVY